VKERGREEVLVGEIEKERECVCVRERDREKGRERKVCVEERADCVCKRG